MSYGTRLAKLEAGTVKPVVCYLWINDPTNVPDHDLEQLKTQRAAEIRVAQKLPADYPVTVYTIGWGPVQERDEVRP